MTTPTPTPAHNRKLKQVTFDLGGTPFQVQLRNWTMNNGTADATIFHTYGGDASSFAEDAEPAWSLACDFYADWRADGISDYLMVNDETDVTFQLDHHPDVVGEHVRWAGVLHIKAPNVGGEVRTTEITSVTFQCVGKPAYSRP
ncbi:hypothetical protein ACU61A_15730 [Pseudonocardia sichuanensis]